MSFGRWVRNATGTTATPGQCIMKKSIKILTQISFEVTVVAKKEREREKKEEPEPFIRY